MVESPSYQRDSSDNCRCGFSQREKKLFSFYPRMRRKSFDPLFESDQMTEETLSDVVILFCQAQTPHFCFFPQQWLVVVVLVAPPRFHSYFTHRTTKKEVSAVGWIPLCFLFFLPGVGGVSLGFAPSQSSKEQENVWKNRFWSHMRLIGSAPLVYFFFFVSFPRRKGENNNGK